MSGRIRINFDKINANESKLQGREVLISKKPKMSFALRVRQFYNSYMYGSSMHKIEFSNYNNFYYVGSLYIGSDQQAVRGYFDTGKSDTLLRISDCDLWYCGYAYEYTDDLERSFNLLGATQTYRHDSGFEWEVEQATATICLSSDPSSCINTFQLLTTESWAAGDFGFFSMNALVGLSSGGDGNTQWLLT